jgi:hypothetical protein
MQIVYLAGTDSKTQDIPGISEVKLDYFTKLCAIAEVIVVSQSVVPKFLINTGSEFTLTTLPSETRGALVSASFALGSMTSGNHYLLKFFELMRQQNYVAGALVMQSENPKYSYARKDKNSNVIEVVEKQVLGNCALAGIYYFNSPDSFLSCAQWALVNNVTTNEQYFLSPALNYFLGSGTEIGLFEIPSDDYFRFDTESIASSSIIKWGELIGKA